MSVVSPSRARSTDSASVSGHQSPWRIVESRSGMFGLGPGQRARQDVASHVRRVDWRHRSPLATEQIGGKIFWALLFLHKIYLIDSWRAFFICIGRGFETIFVHHSFESMHGQKLLETLTWHWCMCCKPANGRVDIEKGLANKTQLQSLEWNESL